jgi:D-glycero-alpha-D-manno-heptose-7-phosphate kinase
MIITQTPFRVSLFGGGTDLKWFYEKHGGQVISFSIDRFVYITGHQMFNSAEILLKYSELERVMNASNIKHRLFRTILERYEISGIDIGVSADIPAGSGLGSSSSFTVGLLNLLNHYLGIDMDSHQLAELACQVEIDDLQQPIGKQDQFAASFGGLNRIHFDENGRTRVSPLVIAPEALRMLNDSLLLVKVGEVRKATEILTRQRDSAKYSNQSIQALIELRELTNAVTTATFENLDELGELLNKSWEIKKISNSLASNPLVDNIVTMGLAAGSSGAKLLGAGSSGFVLFLVKPENQERLLKSFHGYVIEQVRIIDHGSKVIFQDGGKA